ncbi:MAG TPA: FAD binding domain-containing protein, partial [Actinomycetota bacterium]|nr:FAD binding domain-containing protein [Actinomycetota bacterium]
MVAPRQPGKSAFARGGPGYASHYRTQTSTETGGSLYPARFHYEAPRTLEEACQMMAYYREDAKVLAGGMSLIPLMKLRFANPSTIVDINNIPDLDYIEEAGGYLRIGALVRNRDIVRSRLVQASHPLMSSAAPLISDPVVRNRGTLVG